MLRAHVLRPIVLVATILSLIAPAANARESSLVGQPAVRHKQELRDQRFELSPTFEMSVAADYKSTLAGGLKAEFHLTDYLSAGGMLFFGTSVDTALAEQIRSTLPTSQTSAEAAADLTPTREQFDKHMNTTPLHGAVSLTLTPWFGKMAAFGKAFVNFDVYITTGLAFAQTKNGLVKDFCAPVRENPLEVEPAKYRFSDPRNDCAYNSGFSPGLLLGTGLHVYVNKWVAIDFSVHNYMFNDNPSGFDFTGDQKVDDQDRRFQSHLFFGVGASMFLPAKLQISR